MPELDDPSADPVTVQPSADRPSRARWQVGLRTLILLVLTIAVWMAVLVNRRQTAALGPRIKAMQPLAHELVVDDPQKIAVVKREELWFDDNEWDLYVPAGSYRLCIATRGIAENALAPVVKSVPLAAGRHLIALEQQRAGGICRTAVTRRGKTIMAVEEPADWDPGTGSQGGGQYSQCEQLATNQPAILFRRRFMGPRDAKGSSQTPSGPTQGILLWIEPASGPEAKP